MLKRTGILTRSMQCGGHPPARGFTLIEIFIAVAVVGILTAIALPAYKHSVDRTRSTQAKVDIAKMNISIQRAYTASSKYPQTLADVQLDNRVDPWGRPYVYYNIAENGKGHARKDHALNPLNRDFDLYSMGPDGQSKSQITQKDSLDDIIRANDGAFIGIAADF
jgi:general secretion pathway protein G